MRDIVVNSIRKDFNRFYEMLKEQIETCPDELWTSIEGGYPYWQQILHTLALTEMFCMPTGAEPMQNRYGMKGAMLAEIITEPMSRAEMKKLAQDIRPLVDTFLDTMTAEKITSIDEKSTRILNKETYYMDTLLALVRHLTYHIGCCDSILRSHGLKGVY